MSQRKPSEADDLAKYFSHYRGRFPQVGEYCALGQLIVDRGYTALDMARAINMQAYVDGPVTLWPEEYMRAIMLGQEKPSVRTALAICYHFKISPIELAMPGSSTQENWVIEAIVADARHQRLQGNEITTRTRLLLQREANNLMAMERGVVMPEHVPTLSDAVRYAERAYQSDVRQAYESGHKHYLETLRPIDRHVAQLETAFHFFGVDILVDLEGQTATVTKERKEYDRSTYTLEKCAEILGGWRRKLDFIQAYEGYAKKKGHPVAAEALLHSPDVLFDLEKGWHLRHLKVGKAVISGDALKGAFIKEARLRAESLDRLNEALGIKENTQGELQIWHGLSQSVDMRDYLRALAKVRHITAVLGDVLPQVQPKSMGQAPVSPRQS